MLGHLVRLRESFRCGGGGGGAGRGLLLRSRSRLYKFDEVDAYQRSNPYIRSGYRHKLDALACLLSTFSLHNETVNIWTHLLGFVFFAGLLVRDLLLVPSHLRLLEQIALSDLLVLAGVLVCYQVCGGPQYDALVTSLAALNVDMLTFSAVHDPVFPVPHVHLPLEAGVGAMPLPGLGGHHSGAPGHLPQRHILRVLVHMCIRRNKSDYRPYLSHY